MVMDKLSLNGRTAIVAGGGGGGIGTATCLALAAAGAKVIAVDILEERVKDTEDRIAEMGGTCHGIVADLREKEQVDRVIAEAVKTFGAVHHLANVAGGTQPHHWSGMLTQSEQAFDEAINMNLRYVFLICQAAANQMVKQGTGGSIVSVASVSGINSAPMHGPYGAAKAGLMAMTKTMAVEWGGLGIRVNALAPGAVKTPRVMAGGADMDLRAKENIPIQRACEPEDIANGLLFLLSDLADAITGHTLVVDGGAQAKFSLGGRNEDNLPFTRDR